VLASRRSAMLREEAPSMGVETETKELAARVGKGKRGS